MRCWRTTRTARRRCRPGPDPAPDPRREIRWRNIFVREIPAEEANADPGQARRRGFSVRSSTARDFTGWAGPINEYEVVDGAIVPARKGRHDLLQQGVDRLRGPARVQAAARRQQRPGDPLSRERRHGLRGNVRAPDARRHHREIRPSSTRGSRTAQPTAWSRPSAAISAPSAQWNFEEVTVKGSKIKVELNGTVILDSDLSKVKEFMANSRPSRQGPDLGLLRLRRPQRPGRVPQHPDQAFALRYESFPGEAEPAPLRPPFLPRRTLFLEMSQAERAPVIPNKAPPTTTLAIGFVLSA